MMNKPFEKLLEREVPVSWINEPLEQPKRESATARAQRLWFERIPECLGDG